MQTEVLDRTRKLATLRHTAFLLQDIIDQGERLSGEGVSKEYAVAAVLDTALKLAAAKPLHPPDQAQQQPQPDQDRPQEQQQDQQQQATDDNTADDDAARAKVKRRKIDK